MAAVANDIKTWKYGASERLTTAPVGAASQLYVGAVALISAGTGATAGFLKNAATPAAADIVMGIVDEPAGGTLVQTGPGILGNGTDGGVWVNVRTGTFWVIGSGSGIAGATALTAANNGKAVFYAGETAQGPVASASSNAGAFPAMGIQLPQDPGFAGGTLPGATYWPVKFNVIGEP